MCGLGVNTEPVLHKESWDLNRESRGDLLEF